jgi:hypothetical protein
MYETKWYHAYQDGPADNVEYDTEEEAKTALKKIRKDLRRGTCVMSRTRQITE